MTQQRYLGMRPGDLDGRPYAKYWNPNMSPLPEHVQHALAHGVEAAELGFPVSEAGRLLDPGYLPLENGYTRLANGQIFVAVLTKMPGVNSDMIDWWFGWHYMESQRYKLWHPRAHLENRAQKMIGDDPALEDRKKYLDNPNYVTEYIGSDLHEIVITFSPASSYFDVARFKEGNIGTAVCGTVGFQKVPLNFGVLIHLIRETDQGCEMRSRFWLGGARLKVSPPESFVNKILGSKRVARRVAPMQMGRDMVVHCSMEMNHLAGFLPQLYGDYN